MTTSTAPTPRRLRLGWATILVAGLAVVAYISDPLAERLVYLRTAVMRGEVWRLWTGNVVHFGFSHLAWNLAVLLPAGIWLEQVAPARARWFYLIGGGLIGLALLVLEPELAYYGGASGLAAGLLVLLALTQISRKVADRWFWWTVLALVALKVALEYAAGSAIFARFAHDDLHSVPLAHVAGIAGAALIHFRRRRI